LHEIKIFEKQKNNKMNSMSKLYTLILFLCILLAGLEPSQNRLFLPVHGLIHQKIHIFYPFEGLFNRMGNNGLGIGVYHARIRLKFLKIQGAEAFFFLKNGGFFLFFQ
jgi:hypothetical protein